MVDKLKLGIIGMSEGNGHPYSWAAIFNGYNDKMMQSCPFPAIPDYLSKQNYPVDFLDNATVTHVYTQDEEVSNHIAQCSNIPNVATTLDQLIQEVDAVLLARDDAENHSKFVLPILKAGLPIYVDKPFALHTNQAEEFWNATTYEDQIFTCSALQFAEELQLEQLDLNLIGTPKFIWASVAKSWNKYAVHIIEPVLNMFPDRGELISVNRFQNNDGDEKTIQVRWSSGLTANFTTTGSLPSPIWFRVLGDKGFQDLYFKDSYNAFKVALNRFVSVITKKETNINRKLTREMVEILERGNRA